MHTGIDAAVGAVCITAVAVYAWPLLDPSRDWQFVLIWDDDVNFVENDVYKGLSMAHLQGIFTLAIINVWEPFGWLLKALVFAAAGLNARAFRIATLVLHLGAAWILAWTAAFVLAIMHGGIQLTHKVQASRTNSSSAPTDVNPRRHLHGCILAMLVIFVVHPITVEVVTWPSAQPYALAALFSALSLFFHCRRLHRAVVGRLQLQSPRGARGGAPENESMPSDWKRLVMLVAPSLTDRETQLSAASFVAAVLSKSVCILLPVATVLLDCLIILPMAMAIYARSSYFPPLAQCVRFGMQYLWSKSLLVIATGLFVAVTLAVNVEGAHEHADIITLGLSERVIKALSTPAWIMSHVLWPLSLRPHYRLYEDEVALLANPEYLLSITALVLLIVWLFGSRTSAFRFPSLLAVAYFCIMTLPTCGIIQHGIVTKGTDRYAYFPIMVLIPVCGHWLSRQLAEDEANHHKTTVQSHRAGEESVNRLTRGRKHENVPSLPTSENVGPARLVFVAVLALLLVIDAKQMRLWEDSDKFIEHSLRLDPTDSRVLHAAYNHQVKWGAGCGVDRDKCQNWLHLAHHFAPVKTEKAKLYRYMILILLDQKDAACEGFKRMSIEYPQSAVIENNLAVCALTEGRLLEARHHIQHAHTLTFYSQRVRRTICENYDHMLQYITATTTSIGSTLPFDAKILW